ncbi:hypothetical protein J2S41_006814 [Catenuloplanes atrovinosus]|uniref:Uncharacterized protein n=1 Tax=Catenuloplanes atrovinosus TaxID=137266 RepID=A0AAE3YWS1_9ACTN|nr:hypothetical protein [Catenuloplanes atrovinosus]
MVFQLVTVGHDVTDGGLTEGHHGRNRLGGLSTFADLGHPSSLGDHNITHVNAP